jgi:hypothetical protein
MSQFTLGFVYVLQNKAMPGLVKIGETSKLAEDRAQKLFTTGLPMPFEVVFRALTSDPKALETEVHEYLKDRRINTNREFFSVSPEEAINAILLARSKIDGIVKWYGQKPLLQNGDRLILSMRAGQVLIICAYPSINAMEAEVVDVWQAHSDGDTLELYCTDNVEYISAFSKDDPFSDQDPVPFLNRTGTAGNDIIIGRERLMPGDRLAWINDKGAFVPALFELGCYCQVVARTRQPKVLNNSEPLLINYVTRDDFSQEVFAFGKYVQNMRPLRTWAPRDGGPEWVKAGEKEAPPEFWLKQLEKKKREDKKK